MSRIIRFITTRPENTSRYSTPKIKLNCEIFVHTNCEVMRRLIIHRIYQKVKRLSYDYPMDVCDPTILIINIFIRRQSNNSTKGSIIAHNLGLRSLSYYTLKPCSLGTTIHQIIDQQFPRANTHFPISIPHPRNKGGKPVKPAVVNSRHSRIRDPREQFVRTKIIPDLVGLFDQSKPSRRTRSEAFSFL